MVLLNTSRLLGRGENIGLQRTPSTDFSPGECPANELLSCKVISQQYCLQMPLLRKGKRVLVFFCFLFFLIKENQETWFCWRMFTIHLWSCYLQKNEIIAWSQTAKSKARKSELVYKWLVSIKQGYVCCPNYSWWIICSALVGGRFTMISPLLCCSVQPDSLFLCGYYIIIFMYSKHHFLLQASILKAKMKKKKRLFFLLYLLG